MSRPDEARRRAYWSSQMDQAASFMDQAADVPVQECGDPMVSLIAAVKDAGVEVLFSDTTYTTGHQRLFYLRQGLIAGFIAAAREMNRIGWVMKVQDGYRTVDMQTQVGRQPRTFARILKTTLWELDGRMPSPEFILKRFRALVALTPKVGTHTSGSAIDISVFERATGVEVDRGAPYLEMSELTPMASPFVDAQAQANRTLITRIMAAGGLLAYPFEFWHYNGGDAYESLLLKNGPAKYGPIRWEGEGHSIIPLADPLEPLNSVQDMEQSIAQALKTL